MTSCDCQCVGLCAQVCESVLCSVSFGARVSAHLSVCLNVCLLVSAACLQVPAGCVCVCVCVCVCCVVSRRWELVFPSGHSAIGAHPKPPPLVTPIHAARANISQNGSDLVHSTHADTLNSVPLHFSKCWWHPAR